VRFAVFEQRIFISTLGKELVRVKTNPDSSFLGEDGERWSELRAVPITGLAEVIEPSPRIEKGIYL
jgi:hypothetical protein